MRGDVVITTMGIVCSTLSLGILAGTMIVAVYHCIIANVCGRRRQLNSSSRQDTTLPNDHQQRPADEEEPNPAVAGQAEPMFVYGKVNCGRKCYSHSEEGTCAVCLCEYKDGEVIRVLLKCMHTFHAACVDAWLDSHANCPLCRACITPSPPQVAILVDHSGGVTADGYGGDALPENSS